LVPSDRVIVLRSLDVALPDAVTVPVVVTGGHAPAHAPVHMDASPVSLTHRYTARPEPSVRNVPADDVAVVMTVPPDALPLAAALLGAGAAAELLAGAAAGAAVLLLALEHAATRTAAATAPPTPAASFAGPDIRFTMEFFILFVSCLVLWTSQFLLPQVTDDVHTRRRANLDWMPRGKRSVIWVTK
jgi:hypothetical protein